MADHVKSEEAAVSSVPASAQFEIVFATPTRQEIVKIGCASALSAREAVVQARFETRFDEYTRAFFQQAPLGCFGVSLSEPERYCPRNGDRIEVYRPLELDPKQARRARASRGV